MVQKLIKSKSATKSKTAGNQGLSACMEKVENSIARVKLPDFKAGDTVRVHVKIKEGEKERIQAYEGVVVKRGNKGASKSFIVRKISHGVGVERVFLETSPRVAKLEVVQVSRARRAKFYFLRRLEGKSAKVDRELAQKGTSNDSGSDSTPQ